MKVDSPVVLERIYPIEMNMEDSDDRDSIEIHMERYKYASQKLVGRKVLDMASGCGFGTYLMACEHPGISFTGVDIDPKAIEYANARYKSPNLQYICANAVEWSGDRYDSIVSLETIEHVTSPEDLIKNINKLLNDSGRVIASVPVTPTCDGNPHHLHDFTRRSFKGLLSKVNMSPIDDFVQQQNWVYKGLFKKKSTAAVSRSHGVGGNVLKYYREHPMALVSRLTSIVVNGPCNIYLTCVFERK